MKGCGVPQPYGSILFTVLQPTLHQDLYYQQSWAYITCSPGPILPTAVGPTKSWSGIGQIVLSVLFLYQTPTWQYDLYHADCLIPEHFLVPILWCLGKQWIMFFFFFKSCPRKPTINNQPVCIVCIQCWLWLCNSTVDVLVVSSVIMCPSWALYLT